MRYWLRHFSQRHLERTFSTTAARTFEHDRHQTSEHCVQMITARATGCGL